MKWFRFYTEVVEDPKVQTLPAELFKFWVNCLCLCRRNEGNLPPPAQISWTLRLSEKKVLGMIAALRDAELLDEAEGTFRPHNWDRRQYASDNVTERVRKHRERVSETADGTGRKRFRNVSCNGSETPPDTETDTDTESEAENPPPPPPRPEYDGLGPVIPIRTAKDAGLLPPSGPAPAEEPAPRDGAALYLAAYPVQVAQDAGARAYLSVIRTRRQHDELMAGLERHKASALWRDKEGELNLAEIAKWYPPDKFITKRTYQDHPPPRAKPKESTFRDTMDPEVKRRIAEMRAQGIKPGALQ